MDTVRSLGGDRAEQARRMVDDFAGLLATAEALARAGRAVDLRGLDDVCGRLCAAVLDLPPGEGRAFRPALATLLARLDTAWAAFTATPA